MLGAVGIIFGGLSIGQLAARTAQPGGLIAYAAEFVGPGFTGGVGWFQVFFIFQRLSPLYPARLVTIFAACFPFRTHWKRSAWWGSFFHALLFWNICSARLGGILQNAATALKLLPLLLIAVCGLFFGNPGETIGLSAKSPAAAGWISAIGPIAFAYDGWVIATAISHEVKDARRNMPRALLVAPVFVTGIYILYFLGVSSLLGPEAVRTMGDRHVAFLAGRLLGPFGAKVMLLFILIAVAGTLNGVILGYLRLPHALAKRGLLPLSRIFAEPRAFLRALPAYTASCVWAALNYLSERYAWLPNADVSEIPIVMGYLLYAVLYVQVIRLWNQGEIIGFWHGVAIPALALAGAGIVLWGGLQSGAHLFYAGGCLLIIAGGFFYGRRKAGQYKRTSCETPYLSQEILQKIRLNS